VLGVLSLPSVHNLLGVPSELNLCARCAECAECAECAWWSGVPSVLGVSSVPSVPIVPGEASVQFQCSRNEVPATMHHGLTLNQTHNGHWHR